MVIANLVYSSHPRMTQWNYGHGNEAKDGMGMGQDSFPDSPIKVCERDYRDVSGLISRLLETRLGVACICPPVRA